jgi:hypothetical protein
MLKQTMIALTSAAAIGVGFAGSAEAASFSFDLDALSGTPETLQLDKGKYKISLLSQAADGATYDAWSAWKNTTCTDSDGSQDCRGWWGRLTVESSEIESISGGVPVNNAADTYLVWDGLRYPSESTANAAFPETTFTLGQGGSVSFSIADINYSDNRGGLSVHVASVPEPASLLGLAAIGTIAAGGALKKKTAA